MLDRWFERLSDWAYREPINREQYRLTLHRDEWARQAWPNADHAVLAKDRRRGELRFIAGMLGIPAAAAFAFYGLLLLAFYVTGF